MQPHYSCTAEIIMKSEEQQHSWYTARKDLRCVCSFASADVNADRHVTGFSNSCTARRIQLVVIYSLV